MNTKAAAPVGVPQASGLIRRSWPAFMVLVLALFLTLLAARMAQDQVNTKIESLMEFQSNMAVNKLSIAIEQQTDVMRSLQGLYAMNIQVVRDVFELFATVPAEMHKSVTCIAYAPRVRAEDLTAYEAYARNQGLPYLRFAVHPTGGRTEYFPLEYLVPFEVNADDLGLDVFSEPEDSTAITEASLTGEITATPVHENPADADVEFHLIAPIYDGASDPRTPEARAEAFSGICLLRIDARRFVADAIERDTDSSLVSVAVFDGAIPSPSTRIFSEKMPEEALRTQTKVLNFAGHVWTVEIHAGSELAETVNTSMPVFVLVTGIVISLLLFGFVFSLSHSRQRAMDLADRMTRSLRRIVDSSRDIIGSMDTEGRWKGTNRATETILRFTPEEMIGRRHEDLVIDADRGRVAEALRNAPDETSFTLEARYRSKDGETRWISWHITRSMHDGEIYCIGRDVTESVIAENAIRRKSKQLSLAGIITDRENKRKEVSIREQNIQFRMQLTTVMGYLQLVLSQEQPAIDETLDWVREANEGAEGLLEDLLRMTSVELRHIDDVSFDLKPVSALDLGSIVTERARAQLAGIDVGSDPVPEGLARTLVTVDTEKVQYAIDQIVEILRPYAHGGATLTCRIAGGKETLKAELHFRSPHPVAEKDLAEIDGGGSDDRLLGDENEFARALMHSYFEIMDAHFEIEHSRQNAGVIVRFVFPL